MEVYTSEVNGGSFGHRGRGNFGHRGRGNFGHRGRGNFGHGDNDRTLVAFQKWAEDSAIKLSIL